MSQKYWIQVLQSVAAPQEVGNHWEFKAGDECTFGREQGNCIFPDDQQMSRRHMRIRFGPEECILEDLKSTNHTWVNDHMVDNAVLLSHGAKIQAGQTVLQFLVGDLSFPPQPPPPPGPDEDKPPPPPDPYVPRSAPKYAREPCQSGYFACKARRGAPNLQELVTHLAKHSPPHLLIDFVKCGGQAPENTPLEDYLLDHMPPSVRIQHSPVLLSGLDQIPWSLIRGPGWGADAATFFFSQRAHDKLLSHLRRVIKPEPGKIFAFFRPEGIAQLLLTMPEANLRFPMRKIDAVIVNSPSPSPWRAFAGKDFPLEQALAELGMIETNEPEETPKTSAEEDSLMGSR